MVFSYKNAIHKGSGAIENVGIWCWVKDVRGLALATLLNLLPDYKCHETE